MKRLIDNPEENTQSSNLTDSPMPRKRRTESPWFWVKLVGGSLIFHGALLAIALPLTARLSAASQSSPTPVEFVELSEPSPELAVNQPLSESTVSAVPESAPTELTPTQPVTNETIPPSDISFAPELAPTISPSPIPSPEVSTSPESSPEPSPETSPSPEIPTEAPFETAAIPPQPDSLPLPVLPSISPAQPSPEPQQPQQALESTPQGSTPQAPTPEVSPEPVAPEPVALEPITPEVPDGDSDRPQPESTTDITAAVPTPNLPDPQPETLPSDPELQTSAIDIPVPDVSEAIAAAPSTVDSDNLNSANSAAAPVGVTLSLSSSSRVAPGGDQPVETLEIARPINNSTTFLPDPSTSACQLTPDVLNRVGTPIALKITTNEQGEVKNVEVYQSSGSLDYDQLAACLVNEQWRFEPATVLNTNETQREAIASDELLITITINRS